MPFKLLKLLQWAVQRLLVEGKVVVNCREDQADVSFDALAKLQTRRYPNLTIHLSTPLLLHGAGAIIKIVG